MYTKFINSSVKCFNTTCYWLSFINVTSFIRNLYNPKEHSRILPAIIYASLLLVILVTSSQPVICTLRVLTRLAGSFNPNSIDICPGWLCAVTRQYPVYSLQRSTAKMLIRSEYVVAAEDCRKCPSGCHLSLLCDLNLVQLHWAREKCNDLEENNISHYRLQILAASSRWARPQLESHGCSDSKDWIDWLVVVLYHLFTSSLHPLTFYWL